MLETAASQSLPLPILSNEARSEMAGQSGTERVATDSIVALVGWWALFSREMKDNKNQVWRMRWTANVIFEWGRPAAGLTHRRNVPLRWAGAGGAQIAGSGNLHRIWRHVDLLLKTPSHTSLHRSHPPWAPAQPEYRSRNINPMRRIQGDVPLRLSCSLMSPGVRAIR